ncbi:MAG: DUF4153 domain-containing protein [Sphingomonas sp.]|uniref:DUF4153 domain-containing protein n=1 Tax=Sphingomonas sp. TaxID=28214 RepID=UPI0025E49F28|nr:DUF4153 domain-containing protein [Sphingomonas sp.]MBX3565098.1 DUF4153 domain-containing protein [Sphingomonas sp.]
MSDSHETVGASEAEDRSPVWPLRPLLLAVLGFATGLAVHLLVGDLPDFKFTPLLMAELTFITVSAGLIGFTVERRSWPVAVIFSVVAGAIAAAVVWWNGAPDQWSGGDGWRGVSLLLAIAIAAPLFQAARDEGRVRFPYISVHDHAWTNIVLWGASWAFVGVTIALAFLLSQLFHLIKLDFLKDLLEKDWFWRVLIGTAFGGGLGILREHDVVVRTLQRVVLTVLSVLAPVLAAGLIVFVLALPFTGLAPLWEAGSATGILLACIVGSLILANSVIGNAPEEERRFPALRYGAMGLGLVMLPLAVIAAIAIGLRIGQYGFTPERLWALTFVILACAYGVAYLVSLLRGRLDWAAKVRPANLNLAFGTCAIALLLATPLVSFNAIATHDQVARLESGKLSPEKFDWRALAFEFGEPGRKALAKLKMSANAAIRERALAAGKAENRWDVPETQQSQVDVAKHLRVLPAGATLPAGALDALVSQRCGMEEEGGCTVLVVDPATFVLLRDNCFRADRNWPCNGGETFLLAAGKWTEDNRAPMMPASKDTAKAEAQAQKRAYDAGQVQVRKVERRQLFIGGKPVGSVFE